MQPSSPVPSLPWVLIAEDDDDDYFFLQRAISKIANGIQLVHAEDGVEAMRILQENLARPPILLITDLKMPGVDGFGLLSWLRANPTLAKIPVFIWSGSDLSNDRERANSLAARSYHPKGISHDGLPALVTEVCGVLPFGGGP
jgi:CheY-like chemotaxis protein